MANYLGACALSLPAGFCREGLPIGVQLTGAAFTDTYPAGLVNTAAASGSKGMRIPSIVATPLPPRNRSHTG